MARRTPPPRLIGSGLIPETFQSESAGIENEYQGALANLGRDERTLFADYGFQGGVNPDGTVNFQADPTANHGLYQQLLQNIGGQLGAAKTEVRGRGLGRAGLAKARESLIRFMMSGEKQGLLNQFNKGATGIFQGRGTATTARNRDMNSLEGRALDWWNQYGPDDPTGNVGAEDSRPAENPALPSFAPTSNAQTGYNNSMDIAQFLAAQNPAAAYSGDPEAYNQPVYQPPMADPYNATPPRPTRGGGGRNYQTM